MVKAKFKSLGGMFTGISNFKGKFSGRKAVVICSGTSLKNYDDSAIPEDWIRIAVNEGIRKIADSADFWALSDHAIVYEYGELCKPHTTILAMHQSAKLVSRFKKNPDVYTMNSMTFPPREYGNGYEFFSRGTVMIGAIEMARYMGIEEFYIFGLDCYRTEEDYYYDGRTPEHTTERNPTMKNRKGGWARKGWVYKDGLMVSYRLRKMITALDAVKESGLWKGVKVYCVNSPRSQQKAIPLMTLEELDGIINPPKKFPTLVERGLEAFKNTEEKSDDNTEDISSAIVEKNYGKE